MYSAYSMCQNLDPCAQGKTLREPSPYGSWGFAFPSNVSAIAVAGESVVIYEQTGLSE